MKFIFALLLLFAMVTATRAQMTIVKGDYPHDDEWGEWQPVYQHPDFTLFLRTRLCHYMDERGCSKHFAKTQVKRVYTDQFNAHNNNNSRAFTVMYRISGMLYLDAEQTTCSGTPELKKVEIPISISLTSSSDAEEVDEAERNIATVHGFKVKINHIDRTSKVHNAAMGNRG